MKLSPNSKLTLVCILIAALLCGCATLSGASATAGSETNAQGQQGLAAQSQNASHLTPEALEVRTIPVNYTYPTVKDPGAGITGGKSQLSASEELRLYARKTAAASQQPETAAEQPAETDAAAPAETPAQTEAPAQPTAAAALATSAAPAAEPAAQPAAPAGEGVPDNLVLLDTFIATAYCQTGTTSTGTYTTVGRTLSVNPKIIPYGTHVWLFLDDGTFVGDYYAEDTGSNMQAHPYVVDIYMGTSEQTCIEWGARHVSIYVAG